MKCLVPVKRVIDFNVKVRVKPDGSGVETDHVKMSMNPFDEIALEAALRLKEAGHLTEIIAVSIGEQACQETLRVALARGADRAYLIDTKEISDISLEPIHIANILKKFLAQHACELVILGKQAIDDDCNQTGQMLAALLNWPQGTFASKIELEPTQKKVTVTREVDGGLQTLVLQLPAIITSDLRLNEPRYISLPNVMKAKSKPLDILSLKEMDMPLQPHTKVLKVEPAKSRQAGVLVENVQELLDKLMYEAKVL